MTNTTQHRHPNSNNNPMKDKHDTGFDSSPSSSSSSSSSIVAASTARANIYDDDDHDDDDDDDSILNPEHSIATQKSFSSSQTAASLLHGLCTLHRNKWTLTALILLIGAAVSIAFIHVGLTGADNNSEHDFLQRATEITYSIETAWNDYELFGLWIHESCHKPFTTGKEAIMVGQDPSAALGFCNRQEFRKIYEYIMSEGLSLQAAEFLPNITHSARAAIEAEGRAYYATHYPQVPYRGIAQFNVDPPPGTNKTGPSEVKPFYFPVHHVEPVSTNEAAIELDLYSSPVRRKAIDKAIATWNPILSDRLKLVQETDPSAYSILLFHPGTNISGDAVPQPDALSLMVIRVPDLLQRATRKAKNNQAVYVYDCTNTASQPTEPVYMGAVQIKVDNDNDSDSDMVVTLQSIPETNLTHIPRPRGSRYYETKLAIADRQWMVAVVSTTQDTDRLFVILGGCVIFMACVLVAVWFQNHLRIATQMAGTQAILSSLFPKNVQDRLLEQAKNGGVDDDNDDKAIMDSPYAGKKSQLKEFLGSEQVSHHVIAASRHKTKPIADLFPEVTVLFADIVGFTAWSSTREPSQVFTLLECVYHAFDILAKRRNVFKVETVGDCYVAVTGLPDPIPDHAIIMGRFGQDCIHRFATLTRRLEVELGPDTADLGIRVGIHSGPVTSGVLRGDRPRFQLFGDTMNVTARIENSGERNRIHVSKETSDLIKRGGKEHWLVPRREKVHAKGKGELETFWLEPKSTDGGSKSLSHRTSTNASNEDDDGHQHQHHQRLKNADVLATQETKRKRLVEWNTATLAKLLQSIVVRRNLAKPVVSSDAVLSELEQRSKVQETTLLDETVDVIELPLFDAKLASKKKPEQAPSSNHLDPHVESQLCDYVNMISQLYQQNPFHNFEHASHVTMSTVKLLSRIIAPDLEHVDNNVAKGLHDYTYGITSDPLTQFAVVLSALIHDVDHPGVPNAQLVQEETTLALAYCNKSVAEQNSVDIAWNLLMGDGYKELRRTIYVNEKEYAHFRQLVVNVVLATDVMDKELGAARRARWNQAFAPPDDDMVLVKESPQTAIHRKATIVMEHLIQASDVAHTMQHWHVYRKWNARLFEEMVRAYQAGRAEKHPAEFWYEGEKGFLDFYVIPLAKKLKTCGVFGVSSDEYLNYAEKNRREWEAKGQDIVAEMMEGLVPK